VIQVEPVTESGDVVRLRLARHFAGRWAYYYTAAYWVDGLLVDTGCSHTVGQLSSAIGNMGVEQVVNTHSHEDHIGANAAVQEMFRCPVLVHFAALRVLREPELQPLQPYRRLFWGMPKASRGEAIGEWIETRRFGFQVIHTPGHSPDHICLFEPDQGWLFSGDAYIGGEDRALREDYDIHQIIASLKKLAELPVSAIFSGSGTVREGGTKPLLEKIAYLESLGGRVRELRDQGFSPREICRQLLGRELPIAYFTLGHFSGLRLVQSYLHNLPAEESPVDFEHESLNSQGANSKT
jgi:glyoxylase-like metal-dependent hydrolase (beta-lactamase superfamily II)